MRGGCSAGLRSSCRRGFRLQAEAFHRDVAWPAQGAAAVACAWMVEVDCSLVHDLARSARRAETAEVIDAWSAGVDCSLVYDLARGARRAEIAERCVAPGPVTAAWGLSRGSSDHRVVVASAFRRKHSVAST